MANPGNKPDSNNNITTWLVGLVVLAIIIISILTITAILAGPPLV
jgi:hypothetical protein